MSKKDFTKVNPVNRFISQPNEENEIMESKEVKKGRAKAEKEIKKRISLFMLPSLYEDVRKIAYMNKKSIAEQVASCLEKLVEENQDKIEKYDQLD